MSEPSRRRLLVAILGCLAACCSRDPKQTAPSESRPTDPMTTPASLPTYSGPDCEARLEDASGGPLLKVSISVPTGGWALAFDRVERDGKKARALWTLTAPARDEAVIQVLQTLTGEAPIPADADTVQVLVSSEERNLHYFKKPDYALARTLTRKR